MSEFELEQKRNKSHSSPQKSRRRTAPHDYSTESVYRTNVAKMISIKSRPFTVSGRIPFDPATLVLFFRSKVSREALRTIQDLLSWFQGMFGIGC